MIVFACSWPAHYRHACKTGPSSSKSGKHQLLPKVYQQSGCASQRNQGWWWANICQGWTITSIFNNRVLRLPAIVFIEHDVSTRKLGPSSGIRPSFLNRPINVVFNKNDCWNLKTKNSVVECKASENVCENVNIVSLFFTREDQTLTCNRQSAAVFSLLLFTRSSWNVKHAPLKQTGLGEERTLLMLDFWLGSAMLSHDQY